MQSIIEYLLNELADEEIEDIGVDDVYALLESLAGKVMSAKEIIGTLDLYELELNRTAYEGFDSTRLVTKLLNVTAVPGKGYVVGL